ncbi:hypothetical protein [Streptomyces sp. NPDC002133]|uniref:hypothetical protein n=1 Tax=Streptomyces sp. NPDC002133 TaxID=3154409 RepID=UPI00331AE3C9
MWRSTLASRDEPFTNPALFEQRLAALHAETDALREGPVMTLRKTRTICEAVQRTRTS